MRVEGSGREFQPSPDEESELTPFETEVGKQYDTLLAERDELYRQLDTFRFLDYELACFPEMTDETTFKSIVEQWRKKVERETSFFAPLTKLGIRVFVDDLEHQPGFPKEQIIFNSEEVLIENLVHFKAIGGIATHEWSKVKLVFQKPPLRNQMAHFLGTGTLDQAQAALIHELIHRYHMQQKSYVDGVLTEAHAYFSGIFEAGPHFSLTGIAKTLNLPKSEGGIYEYDADEVVRTLITIAGLYGFGKSDDEIGDLIVHSVYNNKNHRFEPLSSKLDELKEIKGLDEIDLQALDDIYRLHFTNQSLKAQLLLFKTLAEHFSLNQLRDAKMKVVQGEVGVPLYWQKGQPVNTSVLLQNVVCPADQEFPYDLNGKRTGIIFGFFHAGEEENGELRFGIGRWEAEGQESTLRLAQTDGERHFYIERLKQQAPLLNGLENKQRLLLNYIEAGLYVNPEVSVVLKAVVSKDDIQRALRYIITRQRESWTNILYQVCYIFDVLDEGKQGSVIERRALHKQYTPYVHNYTLMITEWKQLLATFDVSPEDLDKTFTHNIEELGTRLKFVEVLLAEVGRDQP